MYAAWQNKEITATHEGKKILIPIDEIIESAKSRGFQPDSGPNARAELAIKYIYDIVLRDEAFKYT